MKTLSIIGIVLFGLLTITLWSMAEELEATLDALQTIGGLASLFDAENGLSEFSDTIYGITGCGLIGSLYGVVLSIVGVVRSNRRSPKGDSETQRMLRLQQLSQLKESGALTDAEFEAKKKELIFHN